MAVTYTIPLSFVLYRRGKFASPSGALFLARLDLLISTAKYRCPINLLQDCYCTEA